MPGVVRKASVTAAKIARKEGDEDLRRARRATIEGRDEYWRQRLGDNVPPGYLTNLRKQADALPPTAIDKDGGLAEWTWLGPGSIGGRTRAFIMDPDNPQTMIMGGVSGGIWRATNGGNWWTPVNDFMANLAVSCMAIAPDRQFIFVGTGEGFPGGRVYAGEGVFRSADMGQTWQQLPIANAADFQYVNRIAVHPTVDGRLYILTQNGNLYRSDDDGVSWGTPFLSFGGPRAYDVKICEPPIIADIVW